ncbi:nuclear intron maturase 3, mitochondrial [Salvia miltiorrhiza]|uniref:nuclear intron maturase 3, mitochondrial n=1 Tax=Salvia miltiorrhiza TaxID=226208 RepID=UPI0025AD20B6|nr:nuclear intron maturase 3, mitochondrial [Salvia miltiorrhiza]
MFANFLRKPRVAAIAATAATTAVKPSLFSTLQHPPTEIRPLEKSALQSLVLSHYRHGKFQSLLQNIVASPSLLLTACHNLRKHAPDSPPPPLTLDSVSTHFFSLQELSSQLANNSVDVESCCISVFPKSRKGEALVLPNLKLKVVLEAIRIVLEVIYDDRFVTFCYGGRANMGRHTAIRYLKNSVENPNWWFSVKFDDQLFQSRHVGNLCLMLGQKIDDCDFLDLIRRLFGCRVVSVNLGGVCLGRGLPQECALSSILINVYLNGFDKEIQELRLKTNKENPRFNENELAGSFSVFHKPLKVHAVRYLDEILIITSGSKMMTMDLKKKVVRFLDEELDLKVDGQITVIHSAVSEKIDFMGMELQAVAPSVLRPRKTQKAIRAHKKHLRQKQVRLMELKSAKERNRKKLGMKLLSHVFKKSKQSNGFKFDFQIEDEVRQIFSTWADEVVQEYSASVDERWEWHRMLSAGDFLSLRRIRDQLPHELVDAYDNFQLQVDNYLKPVKAKRELEDEVTRQEEEEEEKYAQRTVEDLTRRCIKVEAPIELLKKAVKMVGFTNQMGRPRPLSLLMVLEDINIIKWYAGVGRRWLDFYSCCHNFKKVKIIVSYHLRFSCILTLAEKHEATKRAAMSHFTKDLKVSGADGTEQVYFPSEREITVMRERNLSDPKPVDGALTMALISLASDEPHHRCTAHFCGNADTTCYRIHLLQNHLDVNPLDDKSWVRGMGAIHDSLQRKCAPLCRHHISELYMGRLTLQDLDCTAFVDVD